MSLTDTAGVDPVAAALAELATLDELNRRRRVHEIIKSLGGRPVAVQQEYRDAIVGAGYIGARDWLSALSEAKKAFIAAKRAEPWAPESRYIANKDGCLYLADETGPVLLAKFVPQVIADITRDDGAEQMNIIRIRVTLPNGRVGEVDVTGERLHKAREWAARAVGASALILPAPRDEAHVLAAAQVLGADQWDRIVEYAHTGWRNIDGRHRYLTASGAIGATGLDPSYHVDLGNPRLNSYSLPDPNAVAVDELRAAVQASLDLRNLAPLKVTAPMLGATYRAPLPILPETSVFAVGQSGSLKTAVSALMCQHWGPALDAKGLPAEWKSTANALEVTAHSLANVLFVIDDYAPQAADDPRKLAAMADRVLRGVANSSGRERLRPDGTPRRSRPPRAQVLTTGEDVPPGQSLRARLTIVEVVRDVIDRDRLTQAQKLATDGVYALAMAGYARWLASRQDDEAGYVTSLRHLMVELRQKVATDGRHLRTPEATAGLLVGWTTWLKYATEIGAVAADDAQQIQADVFAAMMSVADDQASHSSGSSPAQVYIHALATALTGGHAHLADQETGTAPAAMPKVWGWQAYMSGEIEAWRPQGTCIGWVSREGQVYLDSGAAYEVAVAHAAKANMPLATTAVTIHKRLNEGGYLASTDLERKNIQIVRRVLGKTRRVLHVRADLFGSTAGDDQ